MINNFPSNIFVVVMATGIVSIACNLAGLHKISILLFAINILLYIIYLVYLVLKVFKYPRLIWDDLISHEKGPGFLTIVAGTNMLGTQFSLLTPWWEISKVLWGVGIMFWLVILYNVIAGVTIRHDKPDFKLGINGFWLLFTVSSASVCVLGTFVAFHFEHPEVVIFICLMAYMIGIMLYLMIISQIFFRWLFIKMESNAFSPSYWINMGALAISTLAGSRLLLLEKKDSLVHILVPFLIGLNLFLFSFMVWWVPLLIMVFLYKRFKYEAKIKYEIQNWSIIFPLGMFCVASINFLPLVGQGWLVPYINYLVIISLLGWLAVFVGMIKYIFRLFTQ